MSQYRDNASKFGNEVKVFGISVDSTWANKAFREQVGVEFPILSDSKKEVTRKLGILNEQSQMARRSTFVVDANGIIQHIDLDATAIDPNGAIGACSLLKKKAG
ncbi:MAG: redoxin domain-containing protein [Acidobacteria bacterium]|nr:redoxin domain-containing protein [Acidobacteriota bacterium]